MAVGVAVVVFLPNAYTCPEGTELRSQRSHRSNELSYGCWSDLRELAVFLPTEADLDRRVPLRIAVPTAALAIAWGLAYVGNRRSSVVSVAAEGQPTR